MTAIFFIVDGPRLQAQSALLVASLAQYRARDECLIGYAPPQSLHDLPSSLRDLYARAEVDLREIAPVPQSPSARNFAAKRLGQALSAWQ
ncbi:hypothetical protein Q9295_05755 [Xinfangfangia sp. CPCC 101601]|uniref:Universal stress protein n=1 Tax=Pseudogemmobacter lacusdianii TaxID=3069608 RepID=A0ABU0VVU6_9RHOB|nr:hypothetical protein [Xinfangfangia sp. CPCC 101601]MDQ2065867.1 hypothetical protein [Xinfangfangia sp. CPCC 101601]